MSLIIAIIEMAEIIHSIGYVWTSSMGKRVEGTN